MNIPFCKYEGSGNDFILVDNRSGLFPKDNADLVKIMCNRHFGIGSDGLILIEDALEADFNMVFFNPDASSSFCGNGSRCAVLYAQELKMISDTCKYMAIDGLHRAKISGDRVRISMQNVQGVERNEDMLFLNTGSPHSIVFVQDLDTLDILTEARKIRYSERFADKGTNVNFVQRRPDGIEMRTYERGVENETLSCGTGVTAAALCTAQDIHGNQEVQVYTRGGKLSVSFMRNAADSFSDVWLEGPAKFVFDGTYKSH